MKIFRVSGRGDTRPFERIVATSFRTRFERASVRHRGYASDRRMHPLHASCRVRGWGVGPYTPNPTP